MPPTSCLTDTARPLIWSDTFCSLVELGFFRYDSKNKNKNVMILYVCNLKQNVTQPCACKNNIAPIHGLKTKVAAPSSINYEQVTAMPPPEDFVLTCACKKTDGTGVATVSAVYKRENYNSTTTYTKNNLTRHPTPSYAVLYSNFLFFLLGKSGGEGCSRVII